MNENNIVIVVAHPDDAELMFGGIIHKSIQNHQNVSIVIATDGSKWSKIPINSIEELKKIRKNEALKSAKSLGVKEVVFLDLEDGTLSQTRLFPVLFETLRHLRPSFILTHNAHEKHPDHVVVSQTVQRICNINSEPMPLESEFWNSKFPASQQLKGLFVLWKENISKNAIFIHLSKKNIKAKAKAISAYKSQFPSMKLENIYQKELTISGYYGIIAGTNYAEPLEQLNVDNQETIECL